MNILGQIDRNRCVYLLEPFQPPTIFSDGATHDAKSWVCQARPGHPVRDNPIVYFLVSQPTTDADINIDSLTLLSTVV